MSQKPRSKYYSIVILPIANSLILDLEANAGSRVLTPQELLTLIQTQDMGNVLNAGHDDEDLQDDFRGWPARRPRRTLDPNRFPKVPSEEGSKLMHSGQFGANVFAGETKVQKSLAMRLLRRELGLGDEEERRRIRYLIPQVGPSHLRI